MFILGLVIGFGAGVGTALYAPRIWRAITARVKRQIDKITDDVGTGTGL